MKVGDVVQLKSGGPDMTIDSIGDFSFIDTKQDIRATCIWFVDKKKLMDNFPLETLLLISSSEN